MISSTWKLGLVDGGRVFSQSATAFPASVDKQEVTSRVVGLLKSIPLVDPSKVNTTADFKRDLQLDLLDDMEVTKTIEEEFGVNTWRVKPRKILTMAHLIDYITNNSLAK